MSLSDFRQYLAAFADNKRLQSEFQSSYQFHIGFWSGTLYVDEAHGLLRAKENRGWVFEGKDLKSFRISEDGETLFESGDGVLSCHASSVPDRVNGMAQIIAQFHMHKQEYERREACLLYTSPLRAVLIDPPFRHAPFFRCFPERKILVHLTAAFISTDRFLLIRIICHIRKRAGLPSRQIVDNETPKDVLFAVIIGEYPHRFK